MVIHLCIFEMQKSFKPIGFGVKAAFTIFSVTLLARTSFSISCSILFSCTTFSEYFVHLVQQIMHYDLLTNKQTNILIITIEKKLSSNNITCISALFVSF